MHYLFRNVPHGKAKNGNLINTRVHYDYICREGSYSNMRGREEDLVYTKSQNMPAWAESPKEFWQACEDNRTPAARGYREFLLGLQEELTLEDNIDCVEKLLQQTGISENHAYTYAIHDKTATFDKEHRNIHCHLMFNEKIIEKDRPLGPELYFKRYSINLEQELTGGYKSTRDFQSPADIFRLRKTWADIVNSKFAEKNLDCHVDERTLKSQHTELLQQGKLLEAQLINRTPAPHLGNAYLNPRTLERIKETIQEVEEKHDVGEEVEPAKDASEEDKKIILFAKDFLLRKLAKAIQKERMAVLREQKKEQNYSNKEYEDNKAAAYVITASDLAERVDEYIKNSQQIVDSHKATLEKIDSKILEKNEIYKEVYELLFNNEYASTNANYAAVRERISVLSAEKKTYDTAVINGSSYDRKAYATLLDELNSKYDEQRVLGKKIASFKEAMKTELWQKKKEKAVEILQRRNQSYFKERKKAYGYYMSEKRKLLRYEKLKAGLLSMPTDTVIYAEKIPNMVNNHIKLEGVLPISQLQKCKFNNDTYCIIDIEHRNGKKTAKAVKMYDDLTKGKATIYELTIENNLENREYDFILPDTKNNNFNGYNLTENNFINSPGKDLEKRLELSNFNTKAETLEYKVEREKIKISKVIKTKDTISTYAQSNNSTLLKKIKSLKIPKAQNSNTSATIRAKQDSLISRITEIKDIKIPIYYPMDKPKIIDELQRTEIEMSSNWQL